MRTWLLWGGLNLPGGVTMQTYNPVVAPGLTNATKIATGYTHTLAIRADGTVWAWGSNPAGELGNGALGIDAPPAQVAGIDHVIDVAAGVGSAWH